METAFREKVTGVGRKGVDILVFSGKSLCRTLTRKSKCRVRFVAGCWMSQIFVGRLSLYATIVNRASP